MPISALHCTFCRKTLLDSGQKFRSECLQRRSLRRQRLCYIRQGPALRSPSHVHGWVYHPLPIVPKRDYHIPQTDGSRESCPPSHVTCAHHPNDCQMDRRMRSRSDSNDLHATGDSAHPSASIGFTIHPSSSYALAPSNSLSKLGRIGWFQASPIKIRGAIRAKAFSH